MNKTILQLYNIIYKILEFEDRADCAKEIEEKN